MVLHCCAGGGEEMVLLEEAETQVSVSACLKHAKIYLFLAGRCGDPSMDSVSTA